VNTSLACLMALVAAEPAAAPVVEPIYTLSSEFPAAIRGQSPYDRAPGSIGTPSPSGPFIVPPAFLGANQPAAGEIPGALSFGANAGLQPYRLNAWTGRVDVGVLPKAPSSGRLGHFGITEFDLELKMATLAAPGWIVSFAQQFNVRWWDGPSDAGVDGAVAPPTADIPGNGLPSHAFRVGWDLELVSPTQGPWSFQVAFNPALATDFDGGIGSDAWNFDGRAVLLYRYPQWTVALGVGFWDRVKDRVIPYAGIVYRPDDLREWQLTFPKARVSTFMGNWGGAATWSYVSGEYHVEAYEVMVDRTHGAASIRDRIELEDWRLMIGMKQEAGQYSSFVEGGWIFGRNVRFQGPTPGFDISSGLIIRAGVTF